MKFIRTKRGLLLCALLLTVVVGLVWRSRQPGALEQRLARYRAAGLPTTLAELDAWYTPVPDAENATIPLLTAAAALRRGTDTNLYLFQSPHYPPRGQAWSPSLLRAAQVELANNAGPLAQIHAALERPRSRYVIMPSLSVNGFTLPHGAPLWDIFGKLDTQARYAAEIGNPEQAAQSLIDALRAACTLEAEPVFESYQARIILEQATMESLQAVLARITLTEGQLSRLQTAFASATATPHLGRALAGERVHVLALRHTSLRKRIFYNPRPPMDRREIIQAAICDFCDLCGLPQIDLEHRLDRLDELAKAAALPRAEAPEQQRQLEVRLAKMLRSASRWHPLAGQEARQLQRILPDELTWLTTIRCTQTALAIERWRLAHEGALPPSLGELVPQYLNEVPADPMDGRPLKFEVRSSGYKVSGIGEPGLYRGGKSSVFVGPWTICQDYGFTVTR